MAARADVCWRLSGRTGTQGNRSLRRGRWSARLCGGPRGLRGLEGHSLALLAHEPPPWVCPREPMSREARLR